MLHPFKNRSYLYLFLGVTGWLLSTALAFSIDFGSLGDGSFDPGNKNNSLGFYIPSPIKVPGRIEQQQSGFNVLTQKVDLDGWLWESTRSDRPMVKTNQRAALRHYPDGRAYWAFGNKAYPANPAYNDAQLLAQNNNKIIAQQAAAQEAQRRAAAIQSFKKMQQDIFEMPAEKLNDTFKNVQTQNIDEAIVKMHILMREANDLGVTDVSGLERFVKFASIERDRRFMQNQANNNAGGGGGQNGNPAPVAGIGEAVAYSKKLGLAFTPVQRPNGLIGAKVIKAPQPGTPAASVGLEVGDIVIGLDGQGFRNYNDIESHYGDSTIQIINVRTNQRQEMNLQLPN